ncbi:MAG TPA: hypothetical protein VIM88_02565 [Sulfurovum sp.]|uniref:hypothetical protein n=1 Tax=Sulfurovum sp. TaxID=1969726 RepID=UPI002F957AC5
MFKEKILPVCFMVTALLSATGCESKKEPEKEVGYTYSGVYFGKDFSHTYQQGIMDGCITAKGTYKKSHTLFNTDQDYHDGWFLGRNRCRHLLVVEDENRGKLSENNVDK